MRKSLNARLIALTLCLAGTAHSRPAAGPDGMVATAHPAATEAGVSMLRQGGNAADAAVAAAFALAVVEPYSSGLGGGGFALVRFDKKATFVDFREVAPSAATPSMYVVDGVASNILSRDGILSVAVPGAVAGYLKLLEAHGRLPRETVLAPALKLATEGFVVSPRYQRYATRRLELLQQDPEISRIFLRQDSSGNWAAPNLGERIVQTDLAKTLQVLIAQGANAFYRGPLAKLLADDMSKRGGLITAEDLARYTVRNRKPLTGTYRGHTILSSPPPSSGGQILVTLLNVVESLPLPRPWRTPEEIHLYTEAAKRAFADRALLGDPAHVPYVERLIPKLIAKDRGQLLAQAIGKKAAPATEIPPGQGADLPLDIPRAAPTHRPKSNDTTHLSVIDRDGNAIALTTTVNYGWGAGIVAKGTGIVWNDEMDDFSVAPGVPNAYGIVGSLANAVAPGKVPLSSMSPTIVLAGPTLDANVRMVLGSPGGSRIPTTVAQAIINVIDHGANAEQAIALGRIHHQHLPDKLSIEPRSLDAATRQELQARGHTISEREPWSNATIILVDPITALRTGAADPRGIGTAEAQ